MPPPLRTYGVHLRLDFCHGHGTKAGRSQRVGCFEQAVPSRIPAGTSRSALIASRPGGAVAMAGAVRVRAASRRQRRGPLQRMQGHALILGIEQPIKLRAAGMRSAGSSLVPSCPTASRLDRMVLRVFADSAVRALIQATIRFSGFSFTHRATLVSMRSWPCGNVDEEDWRRLGARGLRDSGLACHSVASARNEAPPW